jgi:hypothetical protein
MRLSAWISFWRRSREVQRSGELEDRLRSSLKQTVPERGQPEQPFYEVVRSPGQVLVVERNKAGEAEIEFTVPRGLHVHPVEAPHGAVRVPEGGQERGWALLGPAIRWPVRSAHRRV